jgi:hypothetical protein
MNVSKIAYDKEYYETNFLLLPYLTTPQTNIYFRNVYLSFMMNIIVNKQSKYGIVWYPKCGCSTISNIFCELNDIHLNKEQTSRSLNFYTDQYRYNIYLQNIQLISFIRNPYERFLSTYIDKHIFQNDPIYISLNGFLLYKHTYQKDTIHNLIDFLSNNNNYITDHTKSITNFNNVCPYFNTFSNNISYHNLDNGLEELYHFLKPFHISLFKKDIITKCDNSIISQNNKLHKLNDTEIIDYNNNHKFLHYDVNDWKNYLEQFKINYKYILTNQTLREQIYQLYNDDFIQFNHIF